MRKAVNDNPMVQIAVIVIVGIIFAVILFTSVLKGDEAGEAAVNTGGAPVAATEDGTAVADPAAATTDPAATADPAATVTPPADVAPAPATTPPDTGGSISDGLLPSKGLPRELLVAFAKNETVALLVVDPKRSSDRKVESYTKALEQRDDVEVFIVDVKDIADYSRVTAGVSVSRVPALVVIKPRKLTGSVPTATVSYGFRGARSVNQAVDDALYKGKQLPSYPVDRKSKKNKQGKN